MIMKSIDHEVFDLPISELEASSEFNCRGPIAPIDVADLAKSIDANGLQQPILVHHFNDAEKLKYGKNYRVISGYRRLAAHRALGRQTIPCLIRPWMPETKARVLNLEENLKRENLNILQEAKAIEKLKWAGYSFDDVANELGKSRSWVQIRFNVLDLPEDIQQECASGVLNTIQIKDIYSLPREQQYEAVRTIKDKRIRGEKNIKVKKPVSANSKKARDRAQTRKMLEHIYDNLGPSFGTRCLAWASGNISSLELFNDIRKQMEEQGKFYTIPRDELN